mmetsp:Transcript_140197/g.349430  ORF Transcript_140197/g.349430 Transcript_140197/m.349430 type:complete len:208 (-) Transcript_140197:234-857(-)
MTWPAPSRSRSVASVVLAMAGAFASAPLFASPLAPGPALHPLSGGRSWRRMPGELTGQPTARQGSSSDGGHGTERMTGALWPCGGVAAAAALVLLQRGARGTAIPRHGKNRDSELRFGGRTSMLSRLGYIVPTGLQFAEMPKGFAALSKAPGTSWSHMVLWCAWMRAHQTRPHRGGYAKTPTSKYAGGHRESWTTRLMNSLASTTGL